MTWLSLIVPFIVTCAVIFIPGLIIAWVLRFKGLSLLAATVAAGLAVIAVASVLGPLFHIRWGLLPVLATTVVLSFAGGFIRRWLTTPLPRQRFSWSVFASLGIGAFVIVLTLIRSIGDPENISQTFDAVFHLNAVGHILLNGDASPFHMNLAAPEADTVFYPTLWHAIVSLVVQITGVSTPVATNALVFVVAATIWPLGMLFLASTVFRLTPIHELLVGLFTSVFTAFPYLLIAWGVLYPNFLSTALLPITLAFFYRATQTAQTNERWISWIGFFGAFGAAVLAHPNALFGFTLLVTPLIVSRIAEVATSSQTSLRRILSVTGYVLGLLTLFVPWLFIRTSDNSRTFMNQVLPALREALGQAPMTTLVSFFLAFLVFAGSIILLYRREHRWILVSYTVVVAFFVVAAGTSGPFRSLLTGAWYNDAHRLAALMPIMTVLLASIAASTLVNPLFEKINSRTESHGRREIQTRGLLGSLLVLGTFFFGAHGPAMAHQRGWISELHRPAEPAALLSADERELLERLPMIVPEDALVGGNPWTGTGLALAFGQRSVLFPHLAGNYSDEADYLAEHFSTSGSEICDVVTAAGLTHILDFGEKMYGEDEAEEAIVDLSSPRPEHFKGFDNIDESPLVSLLNVEGEAALYEVSGCN